MTRYDPNTNDPKHGPVGEPPVDFSAIERRVYDDDPDVWQAVDGNPDSETFGEVAFEDEDRDAVEEALQELSDDYELGTKYLDEDVTVDECLTVLLQHLTEPNLDTDAETYQALTHQPEAP